MLFYYSCFRGRRPWENLCGNPSKTWLLNSEELLALSSEAEKDYPSSSSHAFYQGCRLHCSYAAEECICTVDPPYYFCRRRQKKIYQSRQLPDTDNAAGSSLSLFTIMNCKFQVAETNTEIAEGHLVVWSRSQRWYKSRNPYLGWKSGDMLDVR